MAGVHQCMTLFDWRRSPTIQLVALFIISCVRFGCLITISLGAQQRAYYSTLARGKYLRHQIETQIHFVLTIVIVINKLDKWLYCRRQNEIHVLFSLFSRIFVVSPFASILAHSVLALIINLLGDFFLVSFHCFYSTSRSIKQIKSSVGLSICP